MEANNWRAQIHPNLRKMTLNRIADELKQYVPSSKEQLSHITALAMTFEEKIYSMATSQDDYLKRISLKVLSLGGKVNKVLSNSVGSDSCTTDILPHPASHDMPSEKNVQQSPVTTQSDKQSQVRQQHTLQNTPNVIASPVVQGSTSLPSVRSLISGSAHSPMPKVSAENPTQQNISSIVHSSVRTSMAHRASPKTSAGHQRQLLQNQQLGLACQSYVHQQSQPQILKQLKTQNVSGSFQTHKEQEGENQKDQQQLQPFQQPACYQQQHAHPHNHNLLPLKNQSQMMRQRLSTVDVQQGQLINHQNNVAGMQQRGKMLVNGYGNSSMQRDAVALQGQAEHSHPQPWEKHLFTHSKPANLQQDPIPSQQDMQHRLQTSAAVDCRSPTKERASLEKGEKEALEKVEHMKKKYFTTVYSLLNMVIAEVQSHKSLSPQANLEELKKTGIMLVNIASFLKNPQDKNNVYEQLDRAEERINLVIRQARQHISPLGQLPLNVHSMHQTLCPPSHGQIVVEPQPITSSTRLLPDGSTSLSEWHMLHQNMTSLESNPIILQNMQLKQQNVEMLKPRQEIDKQQMHQPLTQQRRQVMQQPPSEFLHAGMVHHQMNGVKNVNLSSGTSVKVSQNQTREIKPKIIKGSGVKPEALQQHQSAGQCSSHPHHRSMSGTLLSANSSELLQSVVPYKNKSNMPGSQAKTGSALCNRDSPSTPCVAPKSTSFPPSSKEVISDVSSLSNAGNDENKHSSVSTSISDESSVAEQPFQRLLKVVKSMSAKALRASIRDIESIVSVTDMMAEVSTSLGGSRGTIGEDLCAMTKCHLQAGCFSHMDDALGTRKRKRGTSQMPLDITAFAGGISGCFDLDKSRLDSSATSCIKWLRVETKFSLLEEIWKVNQRLIDTVVGISDEDGNKTASEYGEGTIVTCSFNAVSVNPNILMPSTLSLWLLVPINYPNCSPALLDNLPPKLSEEDLSEKAKAKLKRSLESLEHPYSIGKIVSCWDCCAREIVLEQAMKYGGGTFTSKYGGWDNCLSAA